MLTQLLAVGLGGFVGALLRFGATGLVERLAGEDGFPAGTFAANVVGCFLLGGLMTLVEERGAFSPAARLFLAVGLLGSFTTFSTFGYETLVLLRDGRHVAALLNAGGSVILGLGAVALGRGAVHAVWGG